VATAAKKKDMQCDAFCVPVDFFSFWRQIETCRQSTHEHNKDKGWLTEQYPLACWEISNKTEEKREKVTG